MGTSSATARVATMVAFTAVTLFFWRTFEIHTPIAHTALRDPSPAGEIVKGFEIRQTVVPTPASSTAEADGETCFGLRFATYRRENSGMLTVAWAQGGHQEKWTVVASQLTDNAIKYFCPKQKLETRLPFTVSITGVDGKLGSAATLWLTHDVSLGHIDRFPDGRALALHVATQKFIGAPKIAGARHYAFLASWVTTVLIGLLALGASGTNFPAKTP